MVDNPITRKLNRTPYEPEIALAICELIADGKTLVEVTDMEGMPARATVYRWLSAFPKFFDAYERAREVSAQSFEDEALRYARELTHANDFTGTKVQAYNIAMQQLRWSASRRDPQRYGQKQITNTTVPIQITTSLNLGQEGMGAPQDIAKSVYTVEATVAVGSGFIEGDEADNVERLVASGEVLDLEPAGEENDALAFGVPEKQKQDLHVPKPGRPRKRHKTPGGTAKTIKAYTKKEAQ